MTTNEEEMKKLNEELKEKVFLLFYLLIKFNQFQNEQYPKIYDFHGDNEWCKDEFGMKECLDVLKNWSKIRKGRTDAEKQKMNESINDDTCFDKLSDQQAFRIEYFIEFVLTEWAKVFNQERFPTESKLLCYKKNLVNYNEVKKCLKALRQRVMKNRVRTYLNPEEFKWYSGELAYGDLDSFGNIRITNDKGNQLFLFERQVTFIFIYY